VFNNFKELSLKIKYDSDEDNILENFYIPVLEHAVTYKRIAGFFSSTSLSIASRGIMGLVKNGGKMQLITSSYLSKQDFEIIKNNTKTKDQIIYENFQKELSELDDHLQKNHLKALGWMLKNELLEIKIVDLQNQLSEKHDRDTPGMFHMKVGILNDGNNLISFSGSINFSQVSLLLSNNLPFDCCH